MPLASPGRIRSAAILILRIKRNSNRHNQKFEFDSFARDPETTHWVEEDPLSICPLSRARRRVQTIATLSATKN